MSDKFIDREKSFEKKFARDEELQFKVQAKSNKYIAEFVSENWREIVPYWGSIIAGDVTLEDGSKFDTDVIYNPKETNFLKKGKDLGNKTENGKKMFIFQAAEAFKIWHDIQPEINEEVRKLLD